MKTLLKALVLSLALTSTLFAYGDWISMNNTGKDQIDFTWNKCYYKGSYNSDWRISIIVKGWCPMWIKYNPETGTWKK